MFAIDAASGVPLNLTGGRSWNMKSHFQRSEGFDACSQFFADTEFAFDCYGIKNPVPPRQMAF